MTCYRLPMAVPLHKHLGVPATLLASTLPALLRPNAETGHHSNVPVPIDADLAVLIVEVAADGCGYGSQSVY
jgi:hypothetical protein